MVIATSCRTLSPSTFSAIPLRWRSVFRGEDLRKLLNLEPEEAESAAVEEELKRRKPKRRGPPRPRSPRRGGGGAPYGTENQPRSSNRGARAPAKMAAIGRFRA